VLTCLLLAGKNQTQRIALAQSAATSAANGFATAANSSASSWTFTRSLAAARNISVAYLAVSVDLATLAPTFYAAPPGPTWKDNPAILAGISVGSVIFAGLMLLALVPCYAAMRLNRRRAKLNVADASVREVGGAAGRKYGSSLTDKAPYEYGVTDEDLDQKAGPSMTSSSLTASQSANRKSAVAAASRSFRGGVNDGASSRPSSMASPVSHLYLSLLVTIRSMMFALSLAECAHDDVLLATAAHSRNAGKHLHVGLASNATRL
jgi:hypothetical protein